MDKDLLRIINNYGVNHQLRKFNEEVFELIEAITNYEDSNAIIDLFNLKVIDSDITKKKHITEELADVIVMLKQLQLYYDIKDENIKEVMKSKINRQLGRIESGE